MNSRQNFIADPVRTRSLQEQLKKTVEANAGEQHHPDPQPCPGIHAPVDGGHKKDVKNLISEDCDHAHQALQPLSQALKEQIHCQLGLINNVHENSNLFLPKIQRTRLNGFG
jgi:hypothetical protein